MAAKFFTGLPLDGPDPECVNGHGDTLLDGVALGSTPRPAMDHTKPARADAGRTAPVQVMLGQTRRAAGLSPVS